MHRAILLTRFCKLLTRVGGRASSAAVATGNSPRTQATWSQTSDSTINVKQWRRRMWLSKNAEDYTGVCVVVLMRLGRLMRQLAVAVSRLRHCSPTPTGTCRLRRWNRLSSRDHCTTSAHDAPAAHATETRVNRTGHVIFFTSYSMANKYKSCHPDGSKR